MFQAWSFLVYRSRVLHKTIQSYHKRRKKHSYNQWTQYNKYIINRQNVQLQYKTNKEIIHNENLTQIKIKKITFQHKQRNAVLIVVNHFKQGNKKKLYQAVSKWKSVTRNDALRDKKKIHILFRMQNRLLFQSFNQWYINIQQKKRNRRLVHKARVGLTKRTLLSVWNAWLYYTHHICQTSKLILKRWIHNYRRTLLTHGYSKLKLLLKNEQMHTNKAISIILSAWMTMKQRNVKLLLRKGFLKFVRNVGISYKYDLIELTAKIPLLLERR